jgi:hypothetical protein
MDTRPDEWEFRVGDVVTVFSQEREVVGAADGLVWLEGHGVIYDADWLLTLCTGVRRRRYAESHERQALRRRRWRYPEAA